MSNIGLSIRLRPTRFAFLVRPDDAKRTLAIFRINTCLWGGKYNPIIPFFKRLPSWWERQNFRVENAKQVINGYLDFFEPDFLVEAEKGLADGFGFDPRRVLQLTDLLACDDERDKRKYGFDVHDLYHDLYRKEFQFERRHKPNIVRVMAKSEDFRNFAACVFGDFPSQEELRSFEQYYNLAFDPEGITLDAQALSRLYESSNISALSLGHAKLKVYFYSGQNSILFIMDALEPRDQIDFWNLRATHQNVVPIPVQWLKELSPFCKQFVLSNYRSLLGNPNRVSIRSQLMFSRSIPENDRKILINRYLRVDKAGAISLKRWYPPIWGEPSGHRDQAMRPTLEADSREKSIPIDENRPVIRFDPLFPEFASELGNWYRWANIVRLESSPNTDLIATVFPCNYKKPLIPNFRLHGEYLLPTTEGLVILPQYKHDYERWELTDGITALKTWFKKNKIEAVTSDAGRATQQIIQTLGGFSGLGSLARKGIVELLNEMSRKPVTKSAHYKKFRNKINNEVAGDGWLAKSFETLVERKAVELGLELKCTKCSSWSWYSVKTLDYTLTCDLCLKQFDFPVTSPTYSEHARWAYRLIGPFALPDYARGGYAAALSIRFFALSLDGMDDAVTWSSGQELTLASGKQVEADFILWRQSKEFRGNDYPTEVVFGEAKSFGKDAFKADDVTKMKRLAEAFPGCILVFATLKEAADLSPKEIEYIKKLAQWGREYDKERKQARAPVIMLTGTELLTAANLRMAWENKGGKHKDLISPPWVTNANLRTLADHTQQLYLGLPSYVEWLEEKWKKRRKRKKEKAS